MGTASNPVPVELPTSRFLVCSASEVAEGRTICGTPQVAPLSRNPRSATSRHRSRRGRLGIPTGKSRPLDGGIRTSRQRNRLDRGRRQGPNSWVSTSRGVAPRPRRCGHRLIRLLVLRVLPLGLSLGDWRCWPLWHNPVLARQAAVASVYADSGSPNVLRRTRPHRRRIAAPRPSGLATAGCGALLRVAMRSSTRRPLRRSGLSLRSPGRPRGH